jgi:hypothetical protein
MITRAAKCEMRPSAPVEPGRSSVEIRSVQRQEIAEKKQSFLRDIHGIHPDTY